MQPIRDELRAAIEDSLQSGKLDPNYRETLEKQVQIWGIDATASVYAVGMMAEELESMADSGDWDETGTKTLRDYSDALDELSDTMAMAAMVAHLKNKTKEK